jgi:ATP-dependent DNA helicase DinG
MAQEALQIDGELLDLFGAESPLAEVLPGFRPREGQARMAGAIRDSMDAGENLVVEAGTGTGKTLAYLIPALLAGRRTIISTGTKNLQDQLFHRDLPMVSAAIGRPARTVQLKGRSNYLCIHRLRAAASDPDQSRENRRHLQVLQIWSQRTRSGDIAEVDAVPEDARIWPQVTSTNENCLGTQCELYDSCHVVAARQAAMAADIVVVNHHLLLADLVLKEEGFGELLPGCEAVIIDEAHQFPDIAQSFFNVSVTSRSLQDLAGDLKAECLGMPDSKLALELADNLIGLVRDARLELRAGDGSLMWEEIGNAFFGQLDDLVAALDATNDWIQGQAKPAAGLQRIAERACSAIERIERINAGDEVSGLRWAGLSRLGFTLNYTPVEIAAALNSLLEAQACSWVFTSATLAVGESFEHFVSRVGLADPRTLAVPSPFNYAECGLLYLPENLPEPSAPGYTQQMLDNLLPLLAASGGRAFLLFTSHRALREAAAYLRDLPDFDYPLLVQGEAPRSKLLEQFAQANGPVLLGTSSFWEGVDMRGEQLVLVAIDRLPFASPGDPMLKARLEAISQAGGQPFSDYQLPQAVLGLKQGVGRLIRDVTDYGVVAICDPRITGKAYGRRFLKSLPPFPVTRDLAEATNFFARRRDVA